MAWMIFVVFNGQPCLLYTSDAADEEDSVDLGGRRIIKKKKKKYKHSGCRIQRKTRNSAAYTQRQRKI